MSVKNQVNEYATMFVLIPLAHIDVTAAMDTNGYLEEYVKV